MLQQNCSRARSLRCGLTRKFPVHCQHEVPSLFNASMNEHRHSTERSREIAPSTIALHLVTAEVAKGYAPAQVLNALRERQWNF